MAVYEIHYAYPTSEMGGKHGCFYSDNSETGEIIKYDSEHVAITQTLEHGKTILCYGNPSRADDYRDLGVVHALDGFPLARVSERRPISPNPTSRT